jgi:hypothetical protein
MARPTNPYSTRTVRLTKLAETLRRLAGRYDLTAMRPASGPTSGVHLGFETGIDDMAPMCGALEHKEMETTDDPSHCADCLFVVRAMGLEDAVKDENGWTGLYLPRNYRGDRTW